MVLTHLARMSPRPEPVSLCGAAASTEGELSTALGGRAYTMLLTPLSVGAMFAEAYPFMLAAVANAA